MEIRFDVNAKSVLMPIFDTQMGKPFLTDVTEYFEAHHIPECWPVVIRWKKFKIKGWYFGNSLLLIERIVKSADTPVLTVQVGE